MLKDKIIGVIGLGYVGLPLAIEFSKKYPTLGFDLNSNRVSEIQKGEDTTLEVSSQVLKENLAPISTNINQLSKGLLVTDQAGDLKDCNIYIITVPTPTDKNKRPVLDPLLLASATVGKALSINDIVVYESTVYPGVTEDECVPVLENSSQLKFNKDFFVGYSPERINPGDKTRTLTSILKITSGSTPEIAKKVDALYVSIIEAGTYLAPSIKVAEAAKVIENSQRDINIAFVNELAKIFNLLQIDTNEVLKAAGTKWNFLPFKPGLVGGHCIGVDPYYIAQKAQEVGYYPEIILAARRLNDTMGNYVASQVIKHMIQSDITVKNAEVLVLGVSFKENCPDIRNSKVVDLVFSLKEYKVNVTIYDPWVKPEEALDEYNLTTFNKLPAKKFDVIVLAVAHNRFLNLDFSLIKKSNAIVYDVKNVLPKSISDFSL